jgi:hypothetical protein
MRLKHGTKAKEKENQLLNEIQTEGLNHAIELNAVSPDQYSVCMYCSQEFPTEVELINHQYAIHERI